MTNCFYKHNVLSFTNDTFDQLDSKVKQLYFYSSENLELNAKLLNPAVFKKLNYISLHDSVKSVDNEILGNLDNLYRIQFEGYFFRKLVHRQGIEWSRSINKPLNVNIIINSSKNKELSLYKVYLFEVFVKLNWGTSVSNIFPDKDFCVYKDFPFYQLVFLFPYFDRYTYTLNYVPQLSCTFRWFARFYKTLWPFLYADTQVYINTTVNAYETSSSKANETCNFARLLANCHRNSHFKHRHIWDLDDVFIINKYLEMIITVSSHVFSIFGIFTNSIFIYIVLSKKNEDMFKDLKHYPFLCAMCVCNLGILIIQVLSWMSECKNIQDIFCPPTSRLVPIQFFKVIFKETLLIALRFASNFAYIGFASNRVALIGKDHVKLVQFISNIKIKNYFMATGFISLCFSIVKVFKYKVNIFFLFALKIDL